jgi:hypothetical protein
MGENHRRQYRYRERAVSSPCALVTCGILRTQRRRVAAEVSAQLRGGYAGRICTNSSPLAFKGFGLIPM